MCCKCRWTCKTFVCGGSDCRRQRDQTLGVVGVDFHSLPARTLMTTTRRLFRHVCIHITNESNPSLQRISCLIRRSITLVSVLDYYGSVFVLGFKAAISFVMIKMRIAEVSDGVPVIVPRERAWWFESTLRRASLVPALLIALLNHARSLLREACINQS